jgi:predicted pyridoxine 5'-phosphate oxidase superfamily flavin-nucleotide-binding protein
MANHYLEILSTPAVIDARNKYYGKPGQVPHGTSPDPLTDDEIDFITTRDSFYMASITENGWPYIQHRGGPRGFLHVTSPSTLAFADYRGNRQLISTGNFAVGDRVSLFLMDYPHRTRLKILGHARVVDARDQSELADSLADPSVRKFVERLFLIDVLSFDWNCPQHITPRFTLEEVNAYVAPLRERVSQLKSELESLRKQQDAQPNN